jgi:hypothetical protein
MTGRRSFTVVAHHPGVTDAHGPLLTRIQVPAEKLDRGPRGYRLAVVDYDASQAKLYEPPDDGDTEVDPFAVPDDATRGERIAAILKDPRFHAQNVYAIAMRTLTRFEYALGRRVGWGFDGQQLKIAPHAFEMRNAFYAKQDQAIFFGYFRDAGGFVHTALGHDLVVHETTHAILDGLRERYVDLSHPDQAAFHEGFADLVALLSVYSLRDVVATLLPEGGAPTLAADQMTVDNLARKVPFLGVADQLAPPSPIPWSGLRRSVRIAPSRKLLDEGQYREAHRRGEVLVAAVMRAFLETWMARVATLGKVGDGEAYDRARVVEEGAEIADCLLTVVIRALDYTPPVDVRFGDYLSALLTSDRENRPDDSKYGLRDRLRTWFGAYGIDPASRPAGDGCWEAPPGDLAYSRTHFESLRTDEAEVFRFLWENRAALRLDEDAYTRVMSVRPCLRVVQDGFTVRETVAEYKQVLHVLSTQLPSPVRAPKDMPLDRGRELKLHGGGTLVFDEYGRLKYHISQGTRSERQNERLASLWREHRDGIFTDGPAPPRRGASPFVRLHLLRAPAEAGEGWAAGAAVPAGAGDEPFPEAAVLDRDTAPAHTRWFCRRVALAHADARAAAEGVTAGDRGRAGEG